MAPGNFEPFFRNMQAPNFSSMVGLGPLALVVMLSYMNINIFLGRGKGPISISYTKFFLSDFKFISKTYCIIVWLVKTENFIRNFLNLMLNKRVYTAYCSF